MRPDVEIWQAIAVGDQSHVKKLLEALPSSWLQQQGVSAAALAQGKGHMDLAESLRREQARASTVDERAARLGEELRAQLANARAAAAATPRALPLAERLQFAKCKFGQRC